MTDIMDQKQRSALMARIRGRDTTPELTVRRIAHQMGLRFRLHREDLPGRPDLVFPKHRLAVFVHGCFWHRHEGCRYASTPKTRQAFWAEKFAANVARDARQEAALKERGWRVLIIWQCETGNEAGVMHRLTALINHERNAAKQDHTPSVVALGARSSTPRLETSADHAIAQEGTNVGSCVVSSTMHSCGEQSQPVVVVR